MVTAGVYMVARSHLVFNRAPDAQMASGDWNPDCDLRRLHRHLQTDIKKVLAYSTISQLGYMFMACGVLDYVGGIFHLMTTPSSRRCCSWRGSVIHGLGGEQDIATWEACASIALHLLVDDHRDLRHRGLPHSPASFRRTDSVSAGAAGITSCGWWRNHAGIRRSTCSGCGS